MQHFLQPSVDELSEWVRRNTKTNQPVPRFPLDKALIMVNDGIRRPGLENLVLLNYHPTAAFRDAKKWLDIERVARGLVFEKETGRLIARPFIKFHNYGEFPEDKSIKNTDIASISYKEDGSLGICFYYNDWWVTTHGSLSSDQGIKGTDILRKKDTSVLRKDVTHMSEIVYPENRIVTNYGDAEDLIFLEAYCLDHVYSNISKKYVQRIKQTVFTYTSPYQDVVTFDTSDVNVIQKIIDYCETQPDFNFEGFVITLNDGRKVKFKTKAYLDVHRCRFAVSIMKVKELMLEAPETLVLWKETLPNEFFDEVESYVKLLTEYATSGHMLITTQLDAWYKEKGIHNGLTIKEISKLLYPNIATLPKHLQNSAWSFVKGKTDIEVFNQILATYTSATIEE